MRRTHIFRFGVLAAALFGAGVVQGQMSPPGRRDWHWPLFETDGVIEDGLYELTVPRPAVWSTNGEYQNFGERRFEGVDPHPGIDIRGQAGDIALFPASGDIIGVQNLDNCEEVSGGDKCRIFVRVAGENLVYYAAHFSYGAAPDGPLKRSYAEKIHNAIAGTGGTSIERGDHAGIIRQYASPAGFDHYHLTIFDPDREYDSLDPLEFLERIPSSRVTLEIVDDERPTVGEIKFVPDGGTVNENGFCGVELTGAVDIKADLRDTFYTRRPTPNFFPGRDEWNNTVGVKGARYIVRPIASAPILSGLWYESPIGCANTPGPTGAPIQCGTWRLRFPSADRGANPPLIASNDDDLFLRYLANGPPLALGGEYGPALWDVSESLSDHIGPNGERKFDAPFISILTNGVTENSVEGVNGAWDTTALEDGRYIVTVEAWDAAGNLGQRSTTVTVNNRGGASSGTGPAWGQVYVRDHLADVGQIPSVLGGEPFWASPDIIVVPKGAAVDASTAATSSSLVVGEWYDVYVRAHNHGCADVSGVQAAVYIATPGTTLSNFRAISGPGWGGTPVTVPGGGSALIGPFTWQVTEEDLDGATRGHRCFVAAIHAPDDAVPTSPDPSTWNVVEQDNVAQRNIQTEALNFEIRNVKPQTLPSTLVIELHDWPPEGTFELLVEQAPQLSGFNYPVENGMYKIEVTGDSLTTPSWEMPGVSQLATEVRFSLPDGTTNKKVTVTHWLGGAIVGGMVFYLSGGPVIR